MSFFFMLLVFLFVCFAVVFFFFPKMKRSSLPALSFLMGSIWSISVREYLPLQPVQNYPGMQQTTSEVLLSFIQKTFFMLNSCALSFYWIWPRAAFLRLSFQVGKIHPFSSNLHRFWATPSQFYLLNPTIPIVFWNKTRLSRKGTAIIIFNRNA